MSGEKKKRRYVRVTRWRRARFFRVLAETGHVGLALEAAGLTSAAVYRLRRVEAGFATKMDSPREAVSERLAEAEAGMRETEGGWHDLPSPCRRSAPAVHCGGECRDRPGDGPAAAIPRRGEGMEEAPLVSVPLPAPGGGLVIRRGIGGRLRVMAAGHRWWDDRADAVFLGHLRATGNVRGSARAAGFTPKSAYNRRQRMASFARAWDAALAEAEQRVEARAVAEALRGTPAMGPGAYEIGEPGRMDPWLAIWLLQWWERKRRRRR